ncbi:MAG: hypothetical protein ABIN45_01600 [Gammaproteobacteria bacterium]
MNKPLYAFIAALALSWVVLAAPVQAENYVIKEVKEVNPGHWILLGLHWVEGLQEIEVKLKVNKDLSAIGTIIRAYFYDQDKRLLTKFESPPAAGSKTPDGVVTLFAKPGTFTKDKIETVYFPITDELTGKWKNVVVVFGDANGVTAQVYPKGKLADYEFNEKKWVK